MYDLIPIPSNIEFASYPDDDMPYVIERNAEEFSKKFRTCI